LIRNTVPDAGLQLARNSPNAVFRRQRRLDEFEFVTLDRQC
jgi:hypothetical protein